jgi:electron transfer flavoprotein alpha subunit
MKGKVSREGGIARWCSSHFAILHIIRDEDVVMDRTNDIVVFLEPPGERGDDINRGLITEGARIARLTGGTVSALTVGTPAVSRESIEGYGAEQLIEVYGDRLFEYTCETYAFAVAKALENFPLALLLFGHTDRGRELAPCVATLLGSVAITDCTDIRFMKGYLSYTRQPYGRQLEEEIHYGASVREVASIRTDGLYRRKEAGSPPVLKVTRKAVNMPTNLRSARPLDTLPPDYRTVDILFARRIVGVGSGAAESLGTVEELAGLLCASLAATRPVVDDGLIGKARMIGQTGKTVTPDLYIALGVSGSPHHVAGIKEARKVLSINLDPNAPMFAFSDTAFVGDIRLLLPKLIARIKRYRNGDSS